MNGGFENPRSACDDTQTITNLYNKKIQHEKFKEIIFFFGFYPCDKQGYCNRVLDFFPVNKFRHRNTTSRGSLLTYSIS